MTRSSSWSTWKPLASLAFCMVSGRFVTEEEFADGVVVFAFEAAHIFNFGSDED